VSGLGKLFPLVAVLTIVAVVGCSSGGPRHVKAKGQLLYKGKPLVVPQKAAVSVRFIAKDGGDNPRIFVADTPFDREGATFTISGNDGRGIPVGTYRIAVTQKMVGDAPPEIDEMNEMFSLKKSAIVREVTGEEPIVIDLSKPEG
jgi:hypothetical protein